MRNLGGDAEIGVSSDRSQISASINWFSYQEAGRRFFIYLETHYFNSGFKTSVPGTNSAQFIVIILISHSSKDVRALKLLIYFRSLSEIGRKGKI